MGRTYTDPSVFAGIAAGADWADPTMDPAEINWPERQARAAIPFDVVDGRPVNPCEKTGIDHGRNEFGHWAEALMADALVVVTVRGQRYLLMIERGDGHGWAVPGGHVEDGESGLAAALRELAEETGFAATDLHWTGQLEPRYVPDPRASDEAWAVTVPVRVDVGSAIALPLVQGADDARRAMWVEADSYQGLEATLADRFGGHVFAAHVAMLSEFLG
jgi:8-oxo-dGTP pyrophosphatase MutT (NUDIX family)